MSSGEEFIVGGESKVQEEWYYATAQTGSLGPYLASEIRDLYQDGKINDSTYVWSTHENELHTDWVPIASIKYLYPAIFRQKNDVAVSTSVNKEDAPVMSVSNKQILADDEGAKMMLEKVKINTVVGREGVIQAIKQEENLSNMLADKYVQDEGFEFDLKEYDADLGDVSKVSPSVQILDKDINNSQQNDPITNSEELDNMLNQLHAFHAEVEDSSVIDNIVKGESSPVSHGSIGFDAKSQCVSGPETNLAKVDGEDSQSSPQKVWLTENELIQSPDGLSREKDLIESLPKDENLWRKSQETVFFSITLLKSKPQTLKNIAPDCSIGELRKKVEDIEEVPANQIVLLHNEEVLSNDSMSLLDYHIPNGGVIVVKITDQVVEDNLLVRPSLLFHQADPPPYEPIDEEPPSDIFIVEKSKHISAAVSTQLSIFDKPEWTLPTSPSIFDKPDDDSSIPESLPSQASIFDIPDDIPPINHSINSQTFDNSKSVSPMKPLQKSSHKQEYRSEEPPSRPSIFEEPLDGFIRPSIEEVPEVKCASLKSSSPEDVGLDEFSATKRESIKEVEKMGFPRKHVIVALELSSFSKQHAIAWLCSKEYEQVKIHEERQRCQSVPNKAVALRKNVGSNLSVQDTGRKGLWSCPVCTFSNNDIMYYCEICGYKKKTLPKVLEGPSGSNLIENADRGKEVNKKIVGRDVDIQNYGNVRSNKAWSEKVRRPKAQSEKVRRPISLADVGKSPNLSYGNYKVTISSAVGLPQKANYCVLTLGRQTKATIRQKKSKNLDFNEVFFFNGVKTDGSYQLRIALMVENWLGDKVVGHVSYALPRKFNRLSEAGLELTNQRNKGAGMLNISVILLNPSGK